MQCTRCHTHMQLAKRENHKDSFLEWHQCPLCKRVEFIAEPVRFELDPSENTVAKSGFQRPAYS